MVIARFSLYPNSTTLSPIALSFWQIVETASHWPKKKDHRELSSLTRSERRDGCVRLSVLPFAGPNNDNTASIGFNPRLICVYPRLISPCVPVFRGLI